MAKGMIKTVQAGMQNASDQKLISHIDTAYKVMTNTDDMKLVGMLSELISEIQEELSQRGYEF